MDKKIPSLQHQFDIFNKIVDEDRKKHNIYTEFEVRFQDKYINKSILPLNQRVIFRVIHIFEHEALFFLKMKMMIIYLLVKHNSLVDHEVIHTS